MKSIRTVISVSFLCVILGLSFVSCSSSPSDCMAEITAGGKTYAAKAENPDDAKRYACNKYCLDTDPECDAMYHIWVTSPKGKAAGSPSKQRALSDDKKLLDCVTIKCANKCLNDEKTGKLQVKASCE